MNDILSQQILAYTSIKAPTYGSMLNGKWGSGKTYYLKEELRELLNGNVNTKQLNIRYTSANGVKEFTEILNEIRLQKISKKSGLDANLIGKVAGGMFNFAFNTIAPTGISSLFNNLKGAVSIDKILDIIKFTEQDLVIFDDLERVHVDCDLIGFIGELNTQLIEHHHVKTIIVCDESELIKRFNPSDRKLKGEVSDYLNAKEKCIRYTIEFNNNLEQALTSIIRKQLLNFPDSNSLKIINKNKSTLLSVISFFKEKNETPRLINKDNGFVNLRTIQFIVDILSRCLGAIDKDKAHMIFEPLTHFVIANSLFLKHADKNKIPPKKNYSGLNPFPSNRDDKEIRNIVNDWIVDKYDVNSTFNIAFNSATIRQLIFNGYLNEDHIKEDVDYQIKLLQLNEQESKDLNKFTFWHNLEDKEFISSWTKIKTHLSEHKFNIGQSISIMLTMSYLVDNGIKLANFEDHQKVSEYFYKYLQNKDLNYIENYYGLKDSSERVKNLSGSRSEYKHIDELVSQKCQERTLSLNMESEESIIEMLRSDQEYFDYRHLRDLPLQLGKDSKKRFYDLYKDSNILKNKLLRMVEEGVNSKNINVQWWVDLNQKTYDKLDDQSISKIKVSRILNLLREQI